MGFEVAVVIWRYAILNEQRGSKGATEAFCSQRENARCSRFESTGLSVRDGVGLFYSDSRRYGRLESESKCSIGARDVK